MVSENACLPWFHQLSVTPIPVRATDYITFLRLFKLPSMRSRFAQYDLLYLRNVFSGRLDCPQVAACFGLLVQGHMRPI